MLESYTSSDDLSFCFVFFLNLEHKRDFRLSTPCMRLGGENEKRRPTPSASSKKKTKKKHNRKIQVIPQCSKATGTKLRLFSSESAAGNAKQVLVPNSDKILLWPEVKTNM